MYAFFLLLVFPALLTGCLKERDRAADVQAAIQKAIEDRLATYRRIRMERCREDMLKEANRQADSIILAEARLEWDTLNRPPKPQRPERPELRPLIDTTPLKPLLPVDTTGRE